MVITNPDTFRYLERKSAAYKYLDLGPQYQPHSHSPTLPPPAGKSRPVKKNLYHLAVFSSKFKIKRSATALEKADQNYVVSV
jgi:hypothetical protein